jgi:hypothetical protein
VDSKELEEALNKKLGAAREQIAEWERDKIWERKSASKKQKQRLLDELKKCH